VWGEGGKKGGGRRTSLSVSLPVETAINFGELGNGSNGKNIIINGISKLGRIWQSYEDGKVKTY